MSTATSHEKGRESTRYGPVAAIFVTAGSFILSQIGLAIIWGIFPVLLGWSQAKTTTWLDTSVFAQFLTVLMLGVVMLGLILLFLRSKKVGLGDIGLIRPAKPARLLPYVVASYIVYIVIFLALAALAKALVPGFDPNQEQDIMFDRESAGGSLWLIFISLVLLPPVVEEIVFRGFLYSGLLRWSKPVAVIITSVLFAAAHLQPGSGQAFLWVAALDTFVLSLVLIYLREKTGSLYASMAVHFIKNGFAFSLLFLVK